MFVRYILAFSLSLASAPAFAQSKEEACGLQGDVVGAIQQARLDRVQRSAVVPTLVAANPEWEKMSAAMPQMVEWVYSLRRRDLRKAELGKAAEAQCLENWDQIQRLNNN